MASILCHASTSFRPWEHGSTCRICHRSFGLFTKRHHCRQCGASVCGAHSRHRFVLPHVIDKFPQRVCNTCHTCLTKNESNNITPVNVNPRKIPYRMHRLVSPSLHQYPWEKPREKEEFRWEGSNLSSESIPSPYEQPTKSKAISDDYDDLSSNASTAYQQSMLAYETPPTRKASRIKSLPDEIEQPIWRVSIPEDQYDDLPTQILTISMLSEVPPMSEFDVDEIRAGGRKSSSCSNDYSAATDSLETENTEDDKQFELVFDGIEAHVGFHMQVESLEQEIKQLRKQLTKLRKSAGAKYQEELSRRQQKRQSERKRITARRHRDNGIELLKEKEPFLAQLEFKHALMYNEKSSLTWHLLAEALIECTWHEEAMLACQYSLEIERTPSSLALLGRIYLAQGHSKEAVDCFQESLSNI